MGLAAAEGPAGAVVPYLLAATCAQVVAGGKKAISSFEEWSGVRIAADPADMEVKDNRACRVFP